MFEPIPKTATDIDKSWLNQALAESHHPCAGEVLSCDVQVIDEVGNTGWYALIDLETKRDSKLPRKLFLKAAGQYFVKASSQYQNYATEIAFYKDIAPKETNRHLEMVFGWADRTVDGGVVVLEAFDPDASLSRRGHISPLEAREVILVIADRHARWWNRELPPSFAEFDGAFPRFFDWVISFYRDVWPWLREPVSRHVPESAIAVSDLIADHGATVLEPIFSEFQTLIQLDCRAENIAFLKEGDRFLPVIYDWQRATVGCGLFDLASLIGTSMTPEDQHQAFDLLDLYVEEVNNRARTPMDRDEALHLFQIGAWGMMVARAAASSHFLQECAKTENPPALDENRHFRTIVRTSNLVHLLGQSR